MRKNFIILFFLFLLNSCVGSSTSGVFGTGVSVALDPRTLGTQIDDSIMQKNLQARLVLSEKRYLIKISVKVNLAIKFFCIIESSIWVPNVLGSKATLTPVPKTPLVEEPTQEFSKNKKNNIIKFFLILFL